MLERMIPALFSVVLLASLTACESPLEADLKAFCAIVQELKADDGTSPPERVKQVQERAAAELQSAEFKALYGTISAAEADARYVMLQEAADEEGMSMWTCFDARTMWKELGEHERVAAFDAAQAEREAADADDADDQGGKSDGDKKAQKKKKKKKKKKRKKRR